MFSGCLAARCVFREVLLTAVACVCVLQTVVELVRGALESIKKGRLVGDVVGMLAQAGICSKGSGAKTRAITSQHTFLVSWPVRCASASCSR